MVAAMGETLTRVARFAVWLGFAALFYRAGLGLTTRVLEPEVAGVVDRALGLAFPLLAVLFWPVNRRLGCLGSGRCVARERLAQPPGH